VKIENEETFAFDGLLPGIPFILRLPNSMVVEADEDGLGVLEVGILSDLTFEWELDVREEDGESDQQRCPTRYTMHYVQSGGRPPLQQVVLIQMIVRQIPAIMNWSAPAEQGF